VITEAYEVFDIIHHVSSGFANIWGWESLFFCFIGVFIGTLVGVLPGIGPIAGMSLLLPATYHTTPMHAIIMLAGIYYGVQYGGSTTSILVNIPGEPSSVVTCIDGYQMALKGRAGSALGIAAFASFIGGTFSIIGLMLIAPPLARVALAFGPPEYFSLLLIGILLATSLGSGSKIKSMMMAVLGLLVGTVGMDMVTGEDRFVYGCLTLIDGIGLGPVAMGLFGISELLTNIPEINAKREVMKTPLRNLLPNSNEWRRSLKPIGRGSILGFLLGVLPGGGAIVSSFASYAIEKKLSKHPEEFGKGAIEGVAGPETANNAAAGGSFIPLLTLGVPANSVMAILLGAFLIHGLQPGAFLMKNDPSIFWGIIASMYVGNVVLLVLNLPLIGLWVQILKIPYVILFPLILLFMILGCYSINSDINELVIMGVFGILGYLLRKFYFNIAPLIFGLILSPLVENAFRQSLTLSYGSFLIFVERPISLIFLLILFLIVLIPVLKQRGWMNWVRRAEELSG
jgi:putative tricarboxylic transport membrane protein